jgi:hypothetical protein
MPSSKYAAYEAIPYFDLVSRGRCRPPLAVVQKRTYAEQKRRKRISFLAEPTKMPITATAIILNMASEAARFQIAREAPGRGPLFVNAPSANSVASTPSITVSQPSTSIILSL